MPGWDQIQMADGTVLDMGTITDGYLLKRSGTGIAEQDPASYATSGHTHTGLALLSVVTSAQTLIGATYADVTSTGISVEASKMYAFEFVIIADSDDVTTGIDVAVNGPSSPTALYYEQHYWTSASAYTVAHATAYDADTASTDSNGTTKRMFRVRGILVNGSNAGTLIARIKREAVGTGPNVRTGSYGIAWKLN